MNGCVVLHSGGMDSSVLLMRMKELLGVHKVLSLGIDYNQRHHRELEAAGLFCQEYGIDRQYIDIPKFSELVGGSSQTDDTIKVPEGHYTEESMKQTVVPNRNMMMISIAAAIAIGKGWDTVAIAAHVGDHAIYPDCRLEFMMALQNALAAGNYKAIDIAAPYLHKTKADILAEGLKNKIDFSLTWSCYNGREFACGKCGTCVERLEAFELCGEVDPLVYES